MAHSLVFLGAKNMTFTPTRLPRHFANLVHVRDNCNYCILLLCSCTDICTTATSFLLCLQNFFCNKKKRCGYPADAKRVQWNVLCRLNLLCLISVVSSCSPGAKPIHTCSRENKVQFPVQHRVCPFCCPCPMG